MSPGYGGMGGFRWMLVRFERQVLRSGMTTTIRRVFGHCQSQPPPEKMDQVHSSFDSIHGSSLRRVEDGMSADEDLVQR